MSSVTLNNIVKRFGTFTAVHRSSLEIPEGAFVTLLGPSGCGKTTNLRMIAGLLDPTEGEILIGGKRVNDVPIHKRNLGLVFQNYALFPHKTVAENVAFGLKYRDVPSSDIPRRVQEALDLVQLPNVGDRYPKALSGGQQQRIALARAIVIEPDVLLLDEPLSALDANLREDMRVELKRIQERIGVTTVFVTHDQEEALEVADTLVVINEGRIEQVGTPDDLYDKPASDFVLSFLGPVTTLGDRLIRPHDIEISRYEQAATVVGTITRWTRIGFEVRLEVTPEGPDAGPPVLVTVTRADATALGLVEGYRVWLKPRPGADRVVHA